MFRRIAQVSTLPNFAPSSSRAASSCAAPSTQGSQCRPALAGRGRSKPFRGVSVSARLFAARQNREKQPESSLSISSVPPKLGRGRTKRRQSTLLSTPEETFDSLKGTVSDSLHLGLTPRHLPLPIPLGTEQYFDAPGTTVNPVPLASEWKNSPLGPFDTSLIGRNILQGDVAAMVKANGDAFDGRRSALNDHLHVMYALARPGRHQHLGAMSPFNGEFFDSDLASLASNLTRTVNEAGARNALAAEQEWNDILAGLGQPSAKAEQAQEVTVAGGERIAVDEAVVDLSQLLYNLEVESTALAAGRTKQKGAKMVAIVDEDGNEEWIRMDSTRRKRKKKINKHKYKKRRKAQRALRKKLGK